MITLKVGELLAVKNSLEKVIEHTKENPLDFTVSYKLGRIFDKAVSVLAEIKYEEKNGNNIRELGEEQFEVDSSGKPVMVKVEGSEEEKRKSIGWQIEPSSKNFPEYAKRTMALQAELVELTNVFKLKSEELIGLKMPLNLIGGLFFIIESDDKEVSTKKEVAN